MDCFNWLLIFLLRNIIDEIHKYLKEMQILIPFNKPLFLGRELYYIKKAIVENNKICGIYFSNFITSNIICQQKGSYLKNVNQLLSNYNYRQSL